MAFNALWLQSPLRVYKNFVKRGDNKQYHNDDKAQIFVTKQEVPLMRNARSCLNNIFSYFYYNLQSKVN